MPELWPFIPDVEVREPVEWLTDVLTAETFEQRIALGLPRRTVAYNFELGADRYAEAELLMRSNILGDWYVPFWPDAMRITAAVSAGAGSITVDTSNRDLRTLAMAWQDDDIYELVTIASDGGSSVTLTGVTTNAYPVGSVLVPVFTGIAAGGLNGERTDKTFDQASVQFSLDEETDIASSPYSQYLSIDVLTDRSVSTTGLRTGVAQNHERVGNRLGKYSLEERSDWLQVMSGIMFVDETPADKWSRRRWVWGLKGRQKPFWLPTWRKDLVLASSIGASDTSITTAHRAGVASGRHIQIDDGSNVYYRQITSVTPGSPNDTIGISSSLGSAVSSATISFLDLVRLDTDLVEFIHSGSERTVVSVPVKGVPA